MSKPTNKKTVTHGGRTIYLNNKELLAEVRECKKRGQMSDLLARMLMLLCSNYARKNNWGGYSYNDDMQGYAVMMLVRTWNSFDPEKSNNPFAFYTQCIKNSFVQYLNQEKRQRDVRDSLLVHQGLNPSFGYDESDTSTRGVEDEQDFDTIRRIAESQSASTYVDAPIERDSSGAEIVVEVPLSPVDDVAGDLEVDGDD